MKDGGRMVLTTPHSFVKFIHILGSKIGLFSKEAAHEHKAFIDYSYISKIAKEIDMRVIAYKKFLFFSNQLMVLGNKAVYFEGY